jgi:small-conductance mechanosensitive channel
MKKLVLVFGLLFAFIGRSQTTIKLDSNIAAKAVDITRVSTETEATNLKLQPHLESDFNKVVLVELDSIIDVKVTAIEDDFENFEKQDLSLIGKSSLDGLMSSWLLNQTSVNAIVGDVRRLFVEVNLNIEVFKNEIEKWNATLEQLKVNESPKELTDNVKALIIQLEKAQNNLNDNLSKLVLMEGKINISSGIILDVNQKLQIALENRSKDIFIQNSPVLWKLDYSSDTNEVAHSDVAKQDSLDNESQGFSLNFFSEEKLKITAEFVTTNQNQIYFHFILWVLTIILSLRIGKKELKLDGLELITFAQQSMIEVRKNMIASATYISILYAILLYPYLPALLSEIMVFILIVLNVIVLRASKGSSIIKIAIVLEIVFMAGQLDVGALLGEVGYRFYLFSKVILTFWVLTLFLKYLNSYQEGNSPLFWKKLNKLANLTYVLLLISFLANILGFIKMADLAVLLVIQLIVVSFIFYGILVTSNGLIGLIYNVTWAPKKESSIKFRDSVEGITLKIVNFLAALAWVQSVLSTVGVYEAIKEVLQGFFVANLQVGSISISIQDVFFSIVVILLTFSITKFIGILITEGGLDRFKFKRGIPNAISLVVRYTLVTLGGLLALSVAGIDLSSFTLLAGALGIGIGFGLQNIISNFVSGLILVFERPLQEGDVVEVNSLLGVVKSIGIRSSNIRTYTGSEVVVPNESLISKELINWTLSDPNKRLEIKIGVEYGSDPRLIIKLLKAAAEANTNVQKDPTPSVYFEEFGDSSLNFRLLFWVDHSIALSVRSDVMLRVSDTLQDHHINIPFPITTVKMDNLNDKLISPELLKDPRRDEDIDNSSNMK